MRRCLPLQTIRWQQAPHILRLVQNLARKKLGKEIKKGKGFYPFPFLISFCRLPPEMLMLFQVSISVCSLLEKRPLKITKIYCGNEISPAIF